MKDQLSSAWECQKKNIFWCESQYLLDIENEISCSVARVQALFSPLPAVDSSRLGILCLKKSVAHSWLMVCKKNIFILCVAESTSSASSLASPWVSVSMPRESKRGVTPPPGSSAIPRISLTESPSPSSLQPEAGDSGEGEYDDGPEYLAIGNLGQRSRRDSQSSTLSSDQGQNQEQTLGLSSVALPLPRRLSFSEGQKGPGRATRGHSRSFSDTGVSQKLRHGEFTWR